MLTEYDLRNVRAVSMWLDIALAMKAKIADTQLAEFDVDSAERAAVAIMDDAARARALTLVSVARTLVRK